MICMNVSLDWTVKETVRAKLRLYVKRILKERGLSPERAGGSDADGPSAGGIALCGVDVNDGTTRPARLPNLECSGGNGTYARPSLFPSIFNASLPFSV